MGQNTDKNHAAVSEREHLRTDHLLQDIAHRAIAGGFVTGGAQAAKFIINFLQAAVLARLLNPREFGLVGMVLGVINLVGIFNVLGLSTATVQRDEITQQQVSNLFWLNVVGSGVLAVMCIAMAPLVAWFYRDPRVTWIMLALSVTFVLTGSAVQHQALLTRQMRFGALGVIEVVSMLVSFVVACLLARLGFAYWALVVQQLVVAAMVLVLAWVTSGWRPSLPSRNSGVRPMIAFGVHLTLADFIARLAATSDNILIGRLFGAAPLGLYTRANVLLARPLQQVLIPIASILVPVLSRVQSDAERYRRTFLRAFELLALVVFPFAALCLALARPLVLVILGSNWADAVPLFSAFALVAVSAPLSSIGSWIFESQGRGGDQLRNHSLAGAVTVAAFLIGLPWGPLGMVIALAFTSIFIRLPLIYYLVGRSGPVRTSDVWSAFLSYLPCWVAFYVPTTLAYMSVKSFSPILQLLICVPTGLAIGAALTFMFRRPREAANYAWRKLKTSFTRQWGGAYANGD